MRKALSQKRYPLLLALAAAAVLTGGVLLKPTKNAAPANVPVSETARLEDLVRRQPLADLREHFAEAAARSAPHVVFIETDGTSGLVSGPERILSSSAPRAGAATVTGAGGRRFQADLAVVSGEFGFSELKVRAPEALEPPANAEMDHVQPGDWVLVVWRRGGGELAFVPATYAGAAETGCGEFPYREVQTSVVLRRSMLGGGLFTPEGELLAAITRCGDRITAVAMDDVESALQRAKSLAGQLLGGYGLGVSPLDERSRRYFGSDRGVLATEVRKGDSAWTAGIRPGDVITSLEGNPVDKPQDLYPLALPAVRASYDVRALRRRRTVKFELRAIFAGSAPPSGGPNGLLLDVSGCCCEVQAIEEGSPAARFGLRRGDRIVAVDFRPPADAATLQAALTAPPTQPRFVVVQRGTRLLGLFLTP